MADVQTKLKGLSQSEVDLRVSQGKVNISANLKTKSVKRIFYDNICTLFNLINVVLFIALLLVGSYKNMLFMGVVVGNIAIGIFQEIRSKISVDKLTILSEKKISVLREGKIIEISKENIVIDDILVFSRGSQIPADCVVCQGECKVNESLLTGESDLIPKQNNDELLSGSFIAAGKCYAKVTKVGADCYAAKINNEAKYIKKVNSQILKSFNFIIKLCTFILLPVGVCFFLRQFGIQGGDLQGTVVSTVAALVGMIPKGMILLTSSVLAVSIVRLSSKKVLVQEMYCIETLARVDVLCLDKTGTLTADEMTVTDVISFTDDESEIKTALASIVNSSDEINATLYAIKDYVEGTTPLKCTSFVPFSSETKWSGGTFENKKSYIIGASEFVFSNKEKYVDVFNKINEISQTVRILALASTDTELKDGKLSDNLTPIALILIKDRLRDNVNETINYFKEQGVTLKVISGDSVKTVRNIAIDTGIEGAENAVDMSTITTDEELYEVAEKCNVFGRVTPVQKKKLVLALKKHGHSVAMTGDGVNDVLALKEADCSVAMASGSDAARNVSQLVLVNNDFASMPDVVAEGRRTINNLERSSSLYLVKTIYSVILSVFFIFFHMSYPFEPIQLTLIGAFTVGLPSFVLALQPNKNIIKGNFTFNIISRALPAALCVIVNIIVIAIISPHFTISEAEFSTISVYMTALSCMLLVFRLSLPLNALRSVMLIVCSSAVVLGSIFFGQFFSLTALSFEGIVILVVFAICTVVIFNVLYNIAEHYIKKFKKQG
ncbi:MAG: HAD-IC family P-type ATPase [Ruminococcus sp.]|nr:HAD-IC family P-type ATPase [Ruminococcus sp.]